MAAEFTGSTANRYDVALAAFGGGNGSFACWCLFDDFSAIRPLWGVALTTNADYVGAANSTTVRLRVNNTNSDFSFTFSTGVWYFIAGSVDGSTHRIEVYNSSSRTWSSFSSSSSNTFRTPSSGHSVGTNGLTQSHDGKICNARLWSVGLNVDEMRRAAWKFFVRADALKFAFPLFTADDVADLSKSANNATKVGSPTTADSWAGGFWGSRRPRIYLPSAAGGSFTKAISGVASFNGALARKSLVRRAGSVGFNGLLLKRSRPLRAGSLSFNGLSLKRTRHLFFAAVGFSGGVTMRRVFVKVLSGLLDFAGLLKKKCGRVISGTVVFSGLLRKLTRVGRSGAVSFSGVLAARRLIFLIKAGVLSFSGTAVGAIQTISTYFRKLLDAHHVTRTSDE